MGPEGWEGLRSITRGWTEYALAAGSVSWEYNFRGPEPDRVTCGSSPLPCSCPFGGVGAAGAFEGCGFSSGQAEPVPWEGSIAQTQPGSFQPCPAHIHGRASLRALCSHWTCCPAISPGHCRRARPAAEPMASLGCSPVPRQSLMFFS